MCHVSNIKIKIDSSRAIEIGEWGTNENCGELLWESVVRKTYRAEVKGKINWVFSTTISIDLFWKQSIPRFWRIVEGIDLGDKKSIGEEKYKFDSSTGAGSAVVEKQGDGMSSSSKIKYTDSDE